VKFANPKTCMPNRNHAIHNYVHGLELNQNDLLPHSTNVAITAFNFANHIGCNPIIFVGLDFCFSREEGKSHASNSALQSNTKFSTENKQLEYTRGELQDNIDCIEIEGIDGNLYPTSSNFHESLRLLESLIAQTKATCIDATEGGAKIAGTEILSLEDTIQQYCTTSIDFSTIIPHEFPKRDHDRFKTSIHSIHNFLQECQTIAHRALQEFDSIDPTGSEIPAPISEARTKLEKEYKLYHILQSALERLLVDISNPDYWNPQREGWQERYKAYFKTIEDACENFIPHFQKLN
jgi:hypothetical protein